MYKTQMEAAKKNIVTPQMKIVAQDENIEVSELMSYMARGPLLSHVTKTMLHLSQEVLVLN